MLQACEAKAAPAPNCPTTSDPCMLPTSKQLQARVDNAVGKKAQRAPVVHQCDEKLNEGAAWLGAWGVGGGGGARSAGCSWTKDSCLALM